MNISSAGNGAIPQTLAGKGSMSASMMKQTAEAEASVAIMATTTSNNNMQALNSTENNAVPRPGSTAKGQYVDIEV
jgi:hypothetical protein